MRIEIVDRKDDKIVSGNFLYIEGVLVEGKKPSFHIQVEEQAGNEYEIHFDDEDTDKLRELIDVLSDILDKEKR